MEKKRQGLAKKRRKRAKKGADFLETTERERAKKGGLNFIFQEKGKGLSFLSKKEKGRELLAIVGQPMTLFFFFWFASFLLVPS